MTPCVHFQDMPGLRLLRFAVDLARRMLGMGS